jgi:hypothetical protein
VLEGLIGNTSRKFGCRTDPMIDGWRVTGWRATLGRLSTHPLFPPIFSVLVATMCVRGVFSLSKIFYFRDLALYHWPHHRWMRRELLLGHSPFWDPNPGGGYATVGDAALHVLFLPTLPLRLLPEIVGFNLIIALPFPVAAIGVYLFARRHASPWGSAIAAIAYSASGPILSSANCNNIAWCVAIIPFIFWAIDGLVRKPSARRFGLLALLFALELLAGEPATLLGTAVMATAYAAITAPDHGAAATQRFRSTLATIGAGISGLMLASMLAFPMFDTVQRSIRGEGLLMDTWSLHPMRLAEAVLPLVYGNYLGLQNEMTPWLFALNSRRDPFLPSLYVGAFALTLAVAGVVSAKRRVWAYFWCGTIGASLLCAFGSMTPVYPALQKLVPLLGNVRYPSKYAVLSMLPLAALVAIGWDGLTVAGARLLATRRVATVTAFLILAGVCAFAILASSGTGSAMLLSFAGVADDSNSGPTASWLSGSIQQRLPSAAIIIAATLLFAWLGGPEKKRASLVRAIAVAVFSIDLVLMNGGLNPTIDASLFDAPDWVAATRLNPTDRVHVAQNFIMTAGRDGSDGPPPPEYPPNVPPAAYLAVWNTTLCQYPSAWDVRQSLSLELTGLRPREYLTLLESFSRAERSEQFRFLRFTGTRYALLQKPPPPPFREIMPLPQIPPMALYELTESESRVRVMTSATVEPDTTRAVEALFNPFVLPTSRVVVGSETPAAGLAGDAADPGAIIIAESTTSVVVQASAPDTGGHLVLLDSFDPGWSATVDGESATVVRAWGVYRAVRLAPGVHTVEFHYVSKPFRIGLVVSLVTGLVLLVLAIRRPRAAAETNDGEAS